VNLPNVRETQAAIFRAGTTIVQQTVAVPRSEWKEFKEFYSIAWNRSKKRTIFWTLYVGGGTAFLTLHILGLHEVADVIPEKLGILAGFFFGGIIDVLRQLFMRGTR